MHEKVEMMVIGDDCGLPPNRIAGQRGIAGTVFMLKVSELGRQVRENKV